MFFLNFADKFLKKEKKLTKNNSKLKNAVTKRLNY
jgi:hypothetical protein